MTVKVHTPSRAQPSRSAGSAGGPVNIDVDEDKHKHTMEVHAENRHEQSARPPSSLPPRRPSLVRFFFIRMLPSTLNCVLGGLATYWVGNCDQSRNCAKALAKCTLGQILISASPAFVLQDIVQMVLQACGLMGDDAAIRHMVRQLTFWFSLNICCLYYAGFFTTVFQQWNNRAGCA